MLRLFSVLLAGVIFLNGCSGEPDPPSDSATATPPPAPAERTIEPATVEPVADPANPAVVETTPGPGQPRMTETPEPPSTDAPPVTPPAVTERKPVTPTKDSKAEKPAVQVATDVDPLFNYVNQDAAVAIVFSPSGVLNNPVVKQIISSVADMGKNGLTDGMKEFERDTGIKMEDVDRVLISATAEQIVGLSAVFTGGPPPNPPMIAIELKSADVADTFFASIPEGEEFNLSGHAAKMTPDGSAALMADDHVMLISTRPRLEQALAAEQPGLLAARLGDTSRKQFAVALNVKSLKPMLKQLAQGAPNPAIMIGMGYVQQIEDLDISMSLEEETLLTVNLDTVSEDSANGLQQMISGLMDQGSQQINQIKQQTTDEKPAVVPLLEMANTVVSGADVTADGKKLAISLPRPKNMDELPKLLTPLLQEAQSAAGLAVRKNNLKQIGLAFHNYHDVYQHFPAVDSNGDQENRRGTGLSWRVHILPFIEQAPLYEQFNLDEPWDSEHNMQLVDAIPELYANGEENGTTTLHVVIGEDAAFQMEGPGPGLRDITDGTSNTVLVAEAGRNKAEIWTKPGGLTIDSDEPLQTLGNVNESFLLLFMDGAVRVVSKNVDADTLLNLFRPKDGNPVGDF